MHNRVPVLLWLAAVGSVALIGVALYEVKQTPPGQAPAVPVDRLPARQPYDRRARWTVTEHLSAHRVLIAQVETEYVHEARAIAEQLTEPVKDKYVEVLIYFHRPGRPDTLPPRRVQWTPQNGYIEAVFGDLSTKN